MDLNEIDFLQDGDRVRCTSINKHTYPSDFIIGRTYLIRRDRDSHSVYVVDEYEGEYLIDGALCLYENFEPLHVQDRIIDLIKRNYVAEPTDSDVAVNNVLNEIAAIMGVKIKKSIVIDVE